MYGKPAVETKKNYEGVQYLIHVKDISFQTF